MESEKVMKKIFPIVILFMLACAVPAATVRNLPRPSAAPTPPPLVMVVNVEKLHVRNAPNGDVVSYRLDGDVVTVSQIEVVGDFAWCEIGAGLWMACEFMEVK